MRALARGRLAAAMLLGGVMLLDGTTAAAQPSLPAAAPADDDAIRRELDELRARQRELERRLDALRAPSSSSSSSPSPSASSSSSPPPWSPSSSASSSSRQRGGVSASPPAAYDGPPDTLAPPPPSPPRFRFGRGGFAISAPDGHSEVRLRAVFNLDGHAYVAGTPLPDTFFIRRARPMIEGTIFDVVDFRLMPDFAQGQATILDAWLELRPWRFFRVRAGRWMVPVGLEWLQHDTQTPFVERSLATDLVPYRDIGLMVLGELGGGAVTYEFTMGNGAPDSGNAPDFDPQSDKDYVGRVFFRPLKPVKRAAFTDLGFGVAGSYGLARGTQSSTGLPTYRSTSLQPIFSYIGAGGAAATLTSVNGATMTEAAVAAGDRWRVTPGAYWYIGPFGLLGEYVLSSQRVERLGVVADLRNRAWNLTASFVLTLERNTFDGVRPRQPVDFRHARFGALMLVARYSELRIDPAAFPNFADPNLAVSAARELAAGLVWFATDYVKVMVSFHRTDFAGGAPGADRPPENALLGRLQLAL